MPIESNFQRSPAQSPLIRHERGALVTPRPIESKLQRSPVHAPRIRGLKGPRTRRAGDIHADQVEVAALPRACPAHPCLERATDAARR